ncbi:oxidoreductase [Anaerovibrio lipolyticus]|uniref:Oxidoreductase n=1 Tax=Anaerovibrio lipolyticus TaxID=82374 RepID=A0A0B2JZN6_9FIRM|nr:Gfo/Idh/MocA family oxidoreductase [Anaerovibrio lipolyticus]KHM51417.1 oxidoreductase [Anaerovibrio lipolyticus]
MKVCFVGIGSIAKRHIRNLSEICNERGIELQIDAFRRSNSVSADNLQQINCIYTSAEELPADYDVIFLTNPTEYHADMLLKLHDHAKHYFIEKPVASLNTVDILKEIPYREDSVYYVACPLRYTHVIQYLKQEINIEAVNSIRCISSSYLPDWRPGQDYRETYSAHKDLGGGVAIDLIHEWDYITYLFGMPSAVKSFLGKVSNLEIDSDDYAIYIAKYDNMIAELHLDYFGHKSVRTVEIYTDEDTLVGDLIAGTVTYLKSGKIINFPADRDLYQKRELEYFLDMISKNGNCSNDISNAVKILKLTQGIIE